MFGARRRFLEWKVKDQQKVINSLCKAASEPERRVGIVWPARARAICEKGMTVPGHIMQNRGDLSIKWVDKVTILEQPDSWSGKSGRATGPEYVRYIYTVDGHSFDITEDGPGRLLVIYESWDAS